MEMFTVSFFGHRRLDNILAVEKALEELICGLLREKEYVEFLVGRDGDFDQLVASTVKRCKRTIRNDNSSLVWVMPYLTAEYRDNEDSFRDYYDEIEVCESSARNHFKAAFQIRNRAMVDRSHLVVFCVERKSGGAYQALEYASKMNIPVVNLV